jgi:hypothetical protein
LCEAKYPLITKKLVSGETGPVRVRFSSKPVPPGLADYTLFKLAYNLIKNKNHLTEKGLLELVALKAVLNQGISLDLSKAFPSSARFVSRYRRYLHTKLT